jgi:hypothetical protein
MQSLLALNSSKLCELFAFCAYQLYDPAARDAMVTADRRCRSYTDQKTTG